MTMSAYRVGENSPTDCGSTEVVGGRNGVNITSEVKVELVHGNNLSIAAYNTP